MGKRRALVSLAVIVAQAAAAAAQERHITVAPGERLRLVEAGSGEPVILVPGLLGSAFGFRKVIGPLAGQGYRVIVVEPLGIGGSGKPEKADYSLTAQAGRIASALQILGVGDAVVVAHSVGASMALRLACRHPELVKAVGLAGRLLRFALLVSLPELVARFPRIGGL